MDMTKMDDTQPDFPLRAAFSGKRVWLSGHTGFKVLRRLGAQQSDPNLLRF
jgi:hypothetical protein